jgi:hypothetical protein
MKSLLLVNQDAFEKDGKRYNVNCTGQFISPRVVLTAAHCVQNNESGAWYDLNKMIFLLQYQNNTYSRDYRPVCLSRFDGWWPQELKDAKTPAEKARAGLSRYQWDYAMILMDRDSPTGYYPKWGTIGSVNTRMQPPPDTRLHCWEAPLSRRRAARFLARPISAR